jgi:hypothetical protein
MIEKEAALAGTFRLGTSETNTSSEVECCGRVEEVFLSPLKLCPIKFRETPVLDIAKKMCANRWLFRCTVRQEEFSLARRFGAKPVTIAFFTNR